VRQNGRDGLKTGLGDGRNRRATPSEAATSVEIKGCGVFDWHFFNGLLTPALRGAAQAASLGARCWAPTTIGSLLKDIHRQQQTQRTTSDCQGDL
jgi:hypothetical protein